MPFLKAADVISGQEGTITFNVEGSIEVGAYVKTFEATLEKQKEEIRTLGHRGTQHKTTGWTGSGTMEMYYVTSLFREMAQRYAKEGRDLYFNITVENNDPTSSIGRQTVVFYDCNVDNTILAKLDVENTALTEDTAFTFDDFQLLNSFSAPGLQANR